MERMPEPQPTSITRDGCRATISFSINSKHNWVVGCVPVPNAMPGINPDGDPIWIGRIHPCGQDEKPLADEDGFVMLFPGFHPVLVVNLLIGGGGKG